jgi:hypothetical protein
MQEGLSVHSVNAGNIMDFLTDGSKSKTVNSNERNYFSVDKKAMGKQSAAST